MDIENKVIGLIGFGNMARAMTRGLLANGVPPSALIAAGPHLQSDDPFLASSQIRLTRSNTEVAIAADVIVLCVKPIHIKSVCDEIAQHVSVASNKIIISIATGVTVQALIRWLKTPLCLRAMPNLPSQIGLGMTGMYCQRTLSDIHRHTAESILGASGKVYWCTAESMMNVVTAFSGSGPGFVFAFCEAMIRAGVSQGLNEEDAKQLWLQTMLGSIVLATQSEISLSMLREQVTSKGGTTAAGLAEMLPILFPLINTTVKASTRRAAEISDSCSTDDRSQ